MTEEEKDVLVVDMVLAPKEPVKREEGEKYIIKKTGTGELIFTKDTLNELQKVLTDNRSLFCKFTENDFNCLNMSFTSKASKFGKSLKHKIGISLRELSDANETKVYEIVYNEDIMIHDLYVWSNISTKRIYPPNMTRKEAANFESVKIEDLSWYDKRLKEMFESDETPEIHAIGEKLIEEFHNVTPKNPFYFIGPPILREGDYEYYCHYEELKDPYQYLFEVNSELHDGTHTIFSGKSSIGFYSSAIDCSFECEQEIHKKMGELKSPRKLERVLKINNEAIFNKPEKELLVEVACTKDGKVIITKELLDQLKSCLVKLREMYSYDTHNPDNDQTLIKYGQVARIDHTFTEPVIYSVFMDELYIVRDSKAGYYKISFKERLLVGSKEVWTNKGQKTLMHCDTTNFSKNKKNAIYEYFTSHMSNGQQRNIFDAVVDNYKKTAISTDYESPFFYTGMPIIGMTEPSATNNGASFYSCRYVSSPEESSSPYSMRSDGVLTIDGELKYKSVNVMEFNDKNIVFDDEAKESISCEMDSLKTEVIKSRGKGNMKEHEKEIAKITACEAPTEVTRFLGPFSLSIIQTLAYGIKPNEIELEKDDENGIYIINVVRRANPNSIHSDICNPYSICITPTFIAGIGVCIDKKTRRKMIHIIKSTYDFGNCTMHHKVCFNDKQYDCLQHDSLCSTIEDKFVDYLRIYFCPLKGWANRTDADIINNTSNTRPIEELAAISEVLKSERSETRNTIRLYNMFWENYSECMIKAGLPEPFDYEKDLEEHLKHDLDLKKRITDELIQSGEV